MIDLSDKQLSLVRDILQQYVTGLEVRAFGSRVKGHAKDYSDLDLVVVDKDRLNRKVIYALQDAFEESALDIKVDVLDWNAISTGFQQIINQQYEIIQSK